MRQQAAAGETPVTKSNRADDPMILNARGQVCVSVTTSSLRFVFLMLFSRSFPLRPRTGAVSTELTGRRRRGLDGVEISRHVPVPTGKKKETKSCDVSALYGTVTGK